MTRQLPILAGLVGTFLAVCTPDTAVANTLSDSCALIESLKTGGPEAGIAYLDSMATAWPQETRAKLRSTLTPILGLNKYVGGNVYLVGDLGDDYREHWIVLHTEQGNPVFLRVSWIRGGQAPMFYNVDFDGGYKESLARRPLLQKPESLQCQS